MAMVPIRSSLPYESDKKIRVRICRMWRPRTFGSGYQYSGLHCILVDEHADAVQATIDEIDYEAVAPKLKSGFVYDISQFHTVKSGLTYKVVPHIAVAYFNERTVFKQLKAVGTKIPMHRFYLLDYSQLASRIDVNTVLTDVIGRITAIQPLEQKRVQNTRIEDKCEIFIENMRREEIRVTLWSDAAKSFDFEGVKQLTPPVFVVFTSLKVKQFMKKTILSSSNSTVTFINPATPNIESYKLAFKDFSMPLKILPSSTSPQLLSAQHQSAPQQTVADLNVLDPNKYKDQIITCRATITRFDTTAGWWYKACPSCYKQLRSIPQSNKFICPRHNTIDSTPVPWFKVSLRIEDISGIANVIVIGKSAEQLFGVSCHSLVVEAGFVDQKQLPDVVLRLKGQTKNFQLRFGTMRTDSNRSDLLIHGVYDDQPLLIESASKPSNEEIAAQKKELSTQSITSTPAHNLQIAPVTPIPTSSTNIPSNTNLVKQAKLAVKRALFTSQQHTKKKYKSHVAIQNQLARTDALQTQEESNLDFDDLPIKALKSKSTTKKSNNSQQQHSTTLQNDPLAAQSEEGKNTTPSAAKPVEDPTDSSDDSIY